MKNPSHPLAKHLRNYVWAPTGQKRTAFGPAGELQIGPTEDYIRTGPYTVAMQMYYTANGGTQYASPFMISHITTWPSDMDRVGMYFNTANQINSRMGVFQKNATGAYPATNSPGSGSIVNTAIRVNSTSGSAQLSENGAATTHSFTRTGETEQFRTGVARYISAGSASANAYSHYILAFDKWLSDYELNQVFADPWSLFADTPHFFPEAAAAGYTHPTLSLATATEITATSFKPRVTYTFS